MEIKEFLMKQLLLWNISLQKEYSEIELNKIIKNLFETNFSRMFNYQ